MLLCILQEIFVEQLPGKARGVRGVYELLKICTSNCKST